MFPLFDYKVSSFFGKKYKASTLNNVIQMKMKAEKQQQHNFGYFTHVSFAVSVESSRQTKQIDNISIRSSIG